MPEIGGKSVLVREWQSQCELFKTQSEGIADASPTPVKYLACYISGDASDNRSVNYSRRNLRESPMRHRHPWNIWHAIYLDLSAIHIPAVWNDPGSQNGLARYWPRSGRPEEINSAWLRFARLGMDMRWITPQNRPRYTGPSPAAKTAGNWATITPTELKHLASTGPSLGTETEPTPPALGHNHTN